MPEQTPGQAPPGFLHFAGFRHWTASLLPAFVGTALPFGLRPRGFSFKWPGAIEFFIATVLFHAGFSLLQARLENRSTAAWPGSRLLGIAGVCLGGGCLLGAHLDRGLALHKGVPGSIFIVYGLCVLFVGVLYVVPPFNFCRRAGGEVVLCEAMGLLPVLGAYIVQVGDLTRTVYLASGPIVVATALWVWTDELITRVDDEQEGRQTMVILFGSRFSARFITPALLVVFYAAFFLAAFASSIPRWTVLIAVLLFGLAWRIASVSWKEYDSSPRMIEARKKAFALHLATCILIAAASLMAACGIILW
ncbi:MAG: prenyltransferase [Bryobacteraceae bacterium]